MIDEESRFAVKGISDTFEVHVGGPTNLELALYAMLEEEGVQFMKEWTVPGCGYRLDAYDPETKTAYEADGPTHDTAKGRKRDRERDAYLLRTPYVDKIIRLKTRDLRSWI